MHRFVWDLRVAPVPGDAGRGGVPLVVPGTYQVRLKAGLPAEAGATPRTEPAKAGDLVETKPLEVKLDPRVATDGVTIADLQEQFDLLRRIQAASSDARETATLIELAIRARSSDRASVSALEALHAKLVTAGGAYPEPMLIDQLSNLARMAGSADQKVGRSAFEYLAELEKELAAIKAEAKKLGA